MKLSQVEEDIQKLYKIKDILEKPIENNAHFIFKTYTETESLEQTRKTVTKADIKKADGNKFQVNDISKFIANGNECVDKDTQKLAQIILKRNSIKR